MNKLTHLGNLPLGSLRVLVAKGLVHGLDFPCIQLALDVSSSDQADHGLVVHDGLQLLALSMGVPLERPSIEAQCEGPKTDIVVQQWIELLSHGLRQTSLCLSFQVAGSPSVHQLALPKESKSTDVSRYMVLWPSDWPNLVAQLLVWSLERWRHLVQLKEDSHAVQFAVRQSHKQWQHLVSALRKQLPSGHNPPFLLSAARHLSRPVFWIDPRTFQVGYGRRGLLFSSTLTDLTSSFGVSCARDKARTNRLLAQAAIPTPQHIEVVDIQGALAAAQNLLGSLRDDVTYTLINVDLGEDSGEDLVFDNSFVIDSSLYRGEDDGDLEVAFDRDADVYGIHMRDELGATTHFADPAALRLGNLAAAGEDYDQDMQTVLNMLDIDQWGFGNTRANVATQAQRLSPIANNSLVLSAFSTGTAVNDSVGMRMHQLRIPESTKAYEEKGVWIRNLYQANTQKSLGQYDGYKSKLTGVSLGLDAYPNRDSLVGLALSHSNTTVKQQDFRLGDEAKQQAWHLSMYAAYNFTPELFVDGVLTHSNVDVTSNRSTAVARTAKAEIDLKQTTAKMNVGYKFKLGESATYLTPFVAWERGSIKQDAYTETGAGDIGLMVQEERLRKSQSTVGLRLEGTTLLGGIVVKPDVAIMSVRDSGTYSKPIRAQFIGDNTAQAQFETASAVDSVRKSTKVSLGLGLLLNKSTSVSLRYEMSERKRDAVFGEGKSLTSDSAEVFVRWNF